jgi:hypothetical protein
MVPRELLGLMTMKFALDLTKLPDLPEEFTWSGWDPREVPAVDVDNLVCQATQLGIVRLVGGGTGSASVQFLGVDDDAYAWRVVVTHSRGKLRLISDYESRDRLAYELFGADAAGAILEEAVEAGNELLGELERFAESRLTRGW